MHNSHRDTERRFQGCRHGRWAWQFSLLGWACILSGCAALTNPVADGIPVRELPPELLAKPRGERKTIPLSLLRQKTHDVYILAPGDVLGVYIETILGEPNTPPPVHFSEKLRLPPGIGYPIDVREDGTISLPRIEPLLVQGMSVAEAEEAVRKAYITKKIFRADKEYRVLVTLLRPRYYHILVIRQEAGNITIGSEGVIGASKRGTGHLVDLPAYENDVLHALAQTGGLPGVEALNEIRIERGSLSGDTDRGTLLHQLTSPQEGSDVLAPAASEIVHIPLRIRPGEPIPFRPEDVVLKNGDVIFVEARDNDLFYTGGLLPPAVHVLPRDYDLDVVEAIARERGPLVNGGFAASNLIGNIIAPGIGGPSPSLLTVIRKTPSCGQVAIRVDLNRALRDPRERILVQPGDVLILQETPCEAVARYLAQTFKGSYYHQTIHANSIDNVSTSLLP